MCVHLGFNGAKGCAGINVGLKKIYILVVYGCGGVGLLGCMIVGCRVVRCRVVGCRAVGYKVVGK